MSPLNAGEAIVSRHRSIWVDFRIAVSIVCVSTRALSVLCECVIARGDHVVKLEKKTFLLLSFCLDFFAIDFCRLPTYIILVWLVRLF